MRIVLSQTSRKCMRWLSLKSTNSYRYVNTLTVVPNENVSDAESVRTFPEQLVTVNTCGKIYEEWRKVKKFRTVPNGDLTFDVKYVDTLKHNQEQSKVNKTSPVVLALHGAPGSYKDFSRLTSHLYDHGVRTISPCFPDFSKHKPGVFRHSAIEKTQFVKDFLAAIDVKCVDLLVCHSAAVYPSLKLCSENERPRISGLAMLNPGAYSTKMRSTRFLPLMLFLAKLSQFEIGLKIVESIGPTFLKLSGSPVRFESIYDPLLSIFSMVYGEIPKSRELLHSLHLKKFPIFFAFSENDKMIQKVLLYKMAYTLGVQDPDIFHVNKEGVIDIIGKVVKNVKVMAFEDGSHYVFSKYPTIINEAVFEFLEERVL